MKYQLHVEILRDFLQKASAIKLSRYLGVTPTKEKTLRLEVVGENKQWIELEAFPIAAAETDDWATGEIKYWSSSTLLNALEQLQADDVVSISSGNISGRNEETGLTVRVVGVEPDRKLQAPPLVETVVVGSISPSDVSLLSRFKFLGLVEGSKLGMPAMRLTGNEAHIIDCMWSNNAVIVTLENSVEDSVLVPLWAWGTIKTFLVDGSPVKILTSKTGDKVALEFPRGRLVWSAFDGVAFPEPSLFSSLRGLTSVQNPATLLLKDVTAAFSAASSINSQWTAVRDGVLSSRSASGDIQVPIEWFPFGSPEDEMFLNGGVLSSILSKFGQSKDEEISISIKAAPSGGRMLCVENEKIYTFTSEKVA